MFESATNHQISSDLKRDSMYPSIQHKISLILLAFALFLVSLATLLTSLWVVWRLGLSPRPGKLFDTDTTRGQILIDHDIEADKVYIGSSIYGLQNLQGNTAILSPGAGLFVSSESGMILQANKGIKINGNVLYSNSNKNIPQAKYKMSNGANQLSSLNGIYNTKMIASPNNKIRSTQVNQSNLDGLNDLNIESKSMTKLSGNRGVLAQAKKVHVDAKKSIVFALHDSIVSFSSNAGIRFQNLNKCSRRLRYTTSRENIQNIDLENDTRFTEQMQEVGQNKASKMCICSNGRVFKIDVKNSETASCLDARFPISENPCT